MEYHTFAIISTIVFYVMLRYKYSHTSNSHSKLVFYTAMLPVILYGYRFLFGGGESFDSTVHTSNDATGPVMTEVMSNSYPMSSSTSSHFDS